jgi:hypothetical protein
MSTYKKLVLLNILSLASVVTVNAEAQTVPVSSTIETNFSVIYSQVAKALHKEYPALFYKSCEEGKEDTYRCGEIPFGKLLKDDLADTKKEAFEVKIPSQSFNNSGYKGTFPASDFPVHISRKQISGAEISELLIDDSEGTQKVSSYFGKDLYVRLFSKNNQLFSTACIYSPGVKIDSPRKVIKFTAKKDLWVSSLKSDITVNIQIKPYSFEAMKSCFSFRIMPVLQGKAISYNTEIIGIATPSIIGLSKGEIIIDVDVKGGNFIGSVLNSYVKGPVTKAIKKSIQDKMGDKVDDFLDKDLENGKWVKKYIDSSYHEYLTNNMAKKIRDAMKIDYTPENDVGDSMVKKCTSMVAGLKLSPAQEYFRSTIAQECQNMRNITFQSFLADSASSSLGCYERYTRISDIDPITKPRYKVLNECKFGHKVELQVKPYLKPLASCLINQWKENFNSDCTKEIQALGTVTNFN